MEDTEWVEVVVESPPPPTLGLPLTVPLPPAKEGEEEGDAWVEEL